MPDRPSDPAGGESPNAQRLTALYRSLLREQPRDSVPPPPGWTIPDDLLKPVLDRDIAAGLEFLSLLDERLRIIDLQLRLGRQQLAVFERRITQATRAVHHRIDEFEQRIAALEAAVRELNK